MDGEARATLIEFIFLRVKGRAIDAFEQNVESLEQYDELFAEWEEGVELSKIELDVALDHKGTQPFAILGQSSSIAKGLQRPMGERDHEYTKVHPHLTTSQMLHLYPLLRHY